MIYDDDARPENLLPGNLRPEDVAAACCPMFEITGPARRLSGGNLNHVWRIPARPDAIILKYAPPFVAAQPDIPLSDTRIDFEAAALRLFSPGGRLEHLKDEAARPPECYHYDAGRKLLLMEDFGEALCLFDDVRIPDSAAVSVGRFLGALHRETYQDDALAGRFNNEEVQKSRQVVQYEAAGDFLAQAGISADPAAVANARALGRFLLEPGRCLVMGDVWPPSVLIRPEGSTGLIDWEFVHFGQPLQDIAHFVAHCELQAEAAAPELQKEIQAFIRGFIIAYRQASGSTFNELYDETQLHHFDVHRAMELLMRTFGPFKAGYIFDGVPPGSPLLRRIAARAHQLLIKPGTAARQMLIHA
ncbi:MAG: phosphotransferase family protein [Cyclonatronaceae bacterium]